MDREAFLSDVGQYLEQYPVVAILGPRQCGKTTLARAYLAQQDSFMPENYFDLEDPEDIARLSEAKTAFMQLDNLIVIDEIQKIPELFPLIRVLVDRDDKAYRFLILGSASRDLINHSSETLAGRIRYLELTPFGHHEVPEQDRLWLRGGFPPAYLAKSEEACFDWIKAYTATFLERDIPSLGIKIPAANLRRFWTMIAHVHGNIFNSSDLGQSLGLSHTTVKRYLDILTGTFMIRQLSPWFENVKKRQVKSPKVYIRDAGILHALLGIQSLSTLLTHPKLGASWEGFALESVIQHYQADPEECYFWKLHSGAELDLMIVKDGRKLGFEFKYGDAPKITPSMRSALEILNLDHLIVIYPGEKTYVFDEKITVKPLSLLP